MDDLAARIAARETPAWAGSYVGIPFAEKGYDRAGCNCWGLYRLVLHDRLRLLLPTFAEDYESTLDLEGCSAAIRRERESSWRELPRGEQRELDLVLIRMRGEELHVGIVLNAETMLHVYEGVNAVIENYQRARWKDRILGFYRHAALASPSEAAPGCAGL